jgi:hypothetical protein
VSVDASILAPVPEPGDLVPSTVGGWMEYPPAACPQGHRLGPGLYAAGWVGCGGGHPGGHRTWCCNRCQHVLHAPPLGDDCHVIDGPARERDHYRGGRSASDTEGAAIGEITGRLSGGV